MKKKINFMLIITLLCIASIVASFIVYFKSSYKILNFAIYFLTGILVASIVGLAASRVQGKKVEQLEQKLGMWNTITYRVKKAGETAFNKMPLGIIVFNDHYTIEWANAFAKKIFNSELLERNIGNLSVDLLKALDKHLPEFKLDLYGKVFSVSHLLSDHVLYFSEITNETNIIERYKQRTLAIGILNLDNLDQTMTTLDAETKALQMSRLIGLLTDWAEKFNLCIKGYSEERYLLIMDYNTLNDVIDDKISIIDQIKEHCEREGLRITVSIGIACSDYSAVDLLQVATDKLELALSRGGNQAIIQKEDNDIYFGAQSEAFESRTPANVRIKTEELLDIIDRFKNVFIMTHRYTDTDAFGACLAASKLCDVKNKPSYIVFDEDLTDTTVKRIYQSIQTTYPLLDEKIITPNEALTKMKDDSLLILVDCQYQDLLVDPRVHKKAKNVALIDHHRRNPSAINDYIFMYSHPSASSSVELIIEMLSFADKNSYEISPIEATWMILGIVVDTNNYMIHTTNRTFNVLSTLQSCGGEMAKVQRYLREDANLYEKKIELLNCLEIIDGYGIVTCDNEIYERSFMAKIADNMITVNGVKAAFCIGKYGEKDIAISARSLDEENVQVLMEKLGGGGHYTTAATQLHDITIQEAKEKLLAVLNSVNGKGEKNMKVILIKDVKGKGKVNDILDIPMGHANFLMRSGQAIEANAENLRQLEANNAIAKEKEEKHLADMKELKTKIEKMEVRVKVKVGANGKLFGSVSTKEVVEKFKEQNGIELDKRKILFDESIDALGTYKIPIQLHKEVTATITLFVVEEGAK